MEFNQSKNNNEKLKLLKNPYLVQYSENIKKAINYSLERGLLEKYEIDPSIIDNYLNKKEGVPLWVVEAACEINLKDIKIPAQYQYLWYCLHNSIVIRKQPSGREFKTKVNFTPCYVKLDKKINKLLRNACEIVNLPFYKFVNLCGIKKTDNKSTISILMLLKVCQIININIWNLLEGYELFGKTKRVGKITILSNKLDVDLMVLLIWLRTEGHIELGSTHIEINQKDNMKSLKEIKGLFIKKFNLKNRNSIFWVGNRGEDRLIISSSPLKQLLCLKYGFPLGYKSDSLQPMNFDVLSKEECKKLMAAFVQTEGCLSHAYTRNKKKKLPKFEFAVKDKSLANDCLIILKRLGFSPRFYERNEKQNLYKVGLYNHKQTIDLVNQVSKHVFDDTKIKHLKEVCTSGIGL